MVDCRAHSLLRYVAEGDIKLSKQGSLSSPLLNTNIPHHQGGEQPSREWQQLRQIRSIGDVYFLSSEGSSSWNDFTLTKGASLRQWQAGEPPNEPIPLRPLQQWLPSADSMYSSNTLVEILGWSEDNPDLINVRTFTSNNSDPIRITSIIRNSTPLLQGGASFTTISPLQALGSYPRRIFLAPTSKHGRAVTHIYLPTLYTSTPTDVNVNWLPEDFLLNLQILGPFEIYSDGSER